MIQTFIKSSAFSLITLLLMSGCVGIPGSHINQQITGLDLFSGDQVKQVDIDADLIQSFRQSTSIKRSLHATPTSIVDNYVYRVGKGDVLSIGVWDHPELTIPAAVQRTAAFDGFRVQSDGTITFAYASKIPAAGKTIVELHGLLVDRLSAVIEDPQVDIKVVGFNSQKVYITGEVNAPGVLPVTEVPLTLIDAINQAGGLTEQAAWEAIQFTRGEQTETISLKSFYHEGDLSANRLLEHGDVIYVNRTDKHRVYVMGEVRDAGLVEINRYGLNLADALGAVGGIKEDSANANGIFVLRNSSSSEGSLQTTVYQLHAKDATALILASEFALQPNDVVYVTTASVARWNRIITKLLPITRSLDDLSQAESRGNIF